MGGGKGVGRVVKRPGAMRYDGQMETGIQVDLPAALQAPGRAEALAAVCERYGVKRLDLFGSAATGRFDPARSDVDLLVEFVVDPPELGWGSFLDLVSDLEQVFSRKVDLITAASLANPYLRRSVLAGKRALYAA